MLSIWARSLLIASRQDDKDGFRWAAPHHWRDDPRISNAERRARRD